MILSLTSPQTIESIDLGTSTPRLSGVIDVSRFANLVGLSANENDIQNFIFPPNNNLEEISLYDNKLQGSVNQYIPLDIKKISLDNNVLTSISSLSSNINLEDFRCSENAITGSLPDISLNSALIIFKIYNNDLTGTIPSLSANETLEDFQVNSNNLTGTIPNLSNNTALRIFKVGGNSNISGSIPSLSANTALTNFEGFFTNISGPIPSLSDNISLKGFFVSNAALTGPIPNLSFNTALVNFVAGENVLTGSIPDLSNNLSLKKFAVKNNNLTGFNGGTVSSTLLDFKANNNNLSATAVNAILAAFVAAGSSNGILDLGGSGNAAPSGQGITDKATLISRNWNVQTN